MIKIICLLYSVAICVNLQHTNKKTTTVSTEWEGTTDIPEEIEVGEDVTTTNSSIPTTPRPDPIEQNDFYNPTRQPPRVAKQQKLKTFQKGKQQPKRKRLKQQRVKKSMKEGTYLPRTPEVALHCTMPSLNITSFYDTEIVKLSYHKTIPSDGSMNQEKAPPVYSYVTSMPSYTWSSVTQDYWIWWYLLGK